MCQKKQSKRRWAKASTPLSLTVTIEYSSCYRGKIEIWKDESGEVVYQTIIR